MLTLTVEFSKQKLQKSLIITQPTGVFCWLGRLRPFQSVGSMASALFNCFFLAKSTL